jgi:hypothetical protein
MHLVPPWMDRDTRTEAERLAHTRARRTWRRLGEWPTEVYADPRLTQLLEKRQAASKLGDAAQSKRLAVEHEQLVLELRRAHAARVMAAPDADPRVAEAYRELVLDAPLDRSEDVFEQEPDAFRPVDPKRAARIAPLLGQLPAAETAAEPKDHALSATGFLARTGQLVNMPYVRFGSSFAGPPAIVRWLRAKGCAGFRYQLRAGQVLEES